MKEKMSNVRNHRIDYLKAIAIIFVVIHHSFSYYGYDNLSCIWKIVYICISSMHVPLFFVVAGYLCHRKRNVRNYIKKKVKRIIIPFFTFSTLKLIYSIFISNEFAHSKSLIIQIVDAYVCGNLYWFAYSIFSMYLMAPFLWKKDKESDLKKLIYVLIGVMLVNIVSDSLGGGVITDINLFQLGKTISYISYFIIGMVYAQKKRTFDNYITKYTKILSGLSIIVIFFLCKGILLFNMEKYFIIRFIFGCSLIYLFVGVIKKLPSNLRFLRIIGNFSLQLMFLDSFNKVIMFKVVEKFISINVYWAIMIAAINVVLSVIVCMSVKKVPYVRYLFGL